MGQDQIVVLRRDGFSLLDFDLKPVTHQEFQVSWDASAASKGGWPSFMAKEIADQPQALADTLMGRVASNGVVTLPDLDGLLGLAAGVRADADAGPAAGPATDAPSRITVLACGTAAYAGRWLATP